MSILFSPLQIRGIRLRNRIVVSPMCQYSSNDGFANDWHLVHLGSRAVGGAGLIIQEATAVEPEGRISYGDMGIWKDEHIEKQKQIVDFIHQHGSIAGIQLAHAGRKASFDLPWKGGHQLTGGERSWQAVAPSPIPFHPGDHPPTELTKGDITRITKSFADAARRSLAAGFKVIELHAAHGYLIHEFLSPLSNHRADEYGGSFDNRIRFLIEITDAIRSIWPEELPLFVRISATDWADNGWSIDESVKLANILKDHAVDLIDNSSGGLVPSVKIPVAPGYQVPFAAAVKQQANILTGAVGLITGAYQAEEILQRGDADLVILARQLLRDPYFPLHAAMELGDKIDWPVQYDRAKPKY